MSKQTRIQLLFGRKNELAKLLPVSREIALSALSLDAKKDITSQACIRNGKAKAFIIAQEKGVISGLSEALAVLSPLKTKVLVKEGQTVKKGSILIEIEGSILEILKRERTALNYLQILSGIATETNKLVKKHGKRIASLRKSHPLLSLSEKRAVEAGGGFSHRLSLSDGYLIKNNHISAIAKEKNCKSRAHAVEIAIQRALSARGNKRAFVEVEVESVPEAKSAAKTSVDAILIDNQTIANAKKTVSAVRSVNKKVIIEASGGITPKNISSYLKTGCDFVSMSHLALKSRPLNLHLVVR